jgi:hypothetical protein
VLKKESCKEFILGGSAYDSIVQNIANEKGKSLVSDVVYIVWYHILHQILNFSICEKIKIDRERFIWC